MMAFVPLLKHKEILSILFLMYTSYGFAYPNIKVNKEYLHFELRQ